MFESGHWPGSRGTMISAEAFYDHRGSHSLSRESAKSITLVNGTILAISGSYLRLFAAHPVFLDHQNKSVEMKFNTKGPRITMTVAAITRIAGSSICTAASPEMRSAR